MCGITKYKLIAVEYKITTHIRNPVIMLTGDLNASPITTSSLLLSKSTYSNALECSLKVFLPNWNTPPLHKTQVWSVIWKITVANRFNEFSTHINIKLAKHFINIFQHFSTNMSSYQEWPKFLSFFYCISMNSTGVPYQMVLIPRQSLNMLKGVPCLIFCV